MNFHRQILVGNTWVNVSLDDFERYHGTKRHGPRGRETYIINGVAFNPWMMVVQDLASAGGRVVR